MVPSDTAIAIPLQGGSIASLWQMAVKSATVIVIGEFFIDEVFAGFNALPKLGEECFARKFRREVGGGAALAACGLARLGASVEAWA